jgi:murein L,D-transpeptidase YcbB/YkuD
MIMIDAEAMPAEPELAADQPQVEDISWTGAPVDLLKPIHHFYTDLRRQLIRYQRDWSSLPQVRVPEKGPPLVLGAQNARIQALRERLGLSPVGSFDTGLAEQVSSFQRVHGLPADGKPGPATLAALNRGAVHYERKLLVNMERARRLPAPGTVKRYILVDAGSARLWMYENGRVVDSMKVILGSPTSATPMMAGLMRFASINPYWNVPVDLVASLIAPRVVSAGTTYLVERRYEVLDSWESDAKVIDPALVDWSAVAAGRAEARVRQLPGGANSMGAIKFMMPNEYGIYLHDTPNKALFGSEDRWGSNGCVRVEDAERLGRWIFGVMPRPTHADREDHLQLYEPMPVYITYLTASPDAGATLFRPDPYQRDAKVLARFAEKTPSMREARPPLTIDLDALPKNGPSGDAKEKLKRQDAGKPGTDWPPMRKTPKPAAVRG